MALCHITGTLFIPDGSEAANRRIQFQKLATDVVTDDYAGAVVPEAIPTKTDANGDVDVYLVTGYYVGTVLDRRGDRSYTFKATVPDQATANIADLITASAPVEPLPAWLQEAFAARDAAEAAEAGAIAAADDAQDSADAAANSASSILGLPLVRYDAQTLAGPQRDQVKSNIGAVSYDAQTLTAAQQTQSRTNIGASQISDNVRYDVAQGLNATQRGVARANIDAAEAHPSAGAVGSFAWAAVPSTPVQYGATVAGSLLQPCGSIRSLILVQGSDAMISSGSGAARVGTWVCLGESVSSATQGGYYSANFATLFRRIV